MFQLSEIVALDDVNMNDEHHFVVDMDDVRVMNNGVADEDQSARRNSRKAMKYDFPPNNSNENLTPMTDIETHELLKRNFVTNHITGEKIRRRPN